VSLDTSLVRRQLVEGEFVVIGAQVTGGEGATAVTFTVNGTAIAVDAQPPFTLAFNVPAGFRSLTFGAEARDAIGATRSARPLSVPVATDLGATITGRVVDTDGTPVAGAVIELLSQGLAAEFFDAAGSLTALPDLAGAQPARSTRVTAINARGPGGIFGPDPFGVGLAPDYAARFSGWISIDTPGRYTFFLGADEGARLTVGGATVVDMPTGSGGFQERSGAISLEAGLVPVEILFYQSAGNTELQLSLAPPGGERQVVAPRSLVPRVPPFVTVTEQSGRFSFHDLPMALEGVSIRAAAGQGSSFTVTVPLIGSLSNAAVELGDVVVPPRK
jgi:hypothetical protein